MKQLPGALVLKCLNSPLCIRKQSKSHIQDRATKDLHSLYFLSNLMLLHWSLPSLVIASAAVAFPMCTSVV